MTDTFRDDFNLGDPKPKPPEAVINRDGWGLFPDMTAEEYHADPCPQPSISNSHMDPILNESPLDFAFGHPRLNDDPEIVKATMERIRGDIVHQLALGKGRGYAVGDFDAWRSKEAKAFKDNAELQGLTPIIREKFEEAEIIAGVIREKVKRFLDGADYMTEVPLMWQEETESGPIWVRAMLDIWCPEKGIVLDPKVTERLHDNVVGSHMVNMGWDRQAALYTHGLAMILPGMAGRIAFADLMVKPKPPFTHRFVEPPKAWNHTSIKQCRIAFERFGACLYAGRWPGYGDKVHRAAMPYWEEKRRTDMEIREGA